MSDLERLTEALERLDNMAPWQFDAADPDCLTFADAARAYRDLLANGERVKWCEEHHATASRGDGLHCLVWFELVDAELANVGACRVVSKLLVDPTTEEER